MSLRCSTMTSWALRSTDSEDYFEVNSDTFVEQLKGEGVLSPTPIFTFTYPNQTEGIYLQSGYAKMNITDAGVAFMNRLMLSDGEFDYHIYNGDYADFIEAFKGFYIRPSESNQLDITSSSVEGATYGFSLASSGFEFYARGKYEQDPTIVKDTVGMSYNFRNTSIIGGGTSVNTVERVYMGSNITPEKVKTKSGEVVPTTGILAIEGMGGIVSELTFEQSLFQQLEQEIAKGESGFDNILFNTARMEVYNLHATGYGVYTEDPAEYTLDDMPTRLVLYSFYSTYLDEDKSIWMAETAADYNYYGEISGGVPSSIDGYLNRSRGKEYAQYTASDAGFWNDYNEAKAANAGQLITRSSGTHSSGISCIWDPSYRTSSPRYGLLQVRPMG